MTWFRRLFDPPRTGAPANPPDPPDTEFAGALRDRGGVIRRLEIGDVTEEFQRRLRAACEAHGDIAAVWLRWITSPGELLISVRFEQANEQAVQRFAARMAVLGGPPCVIAVATGTPGGAPFYL